MDLTDDEKKLVQPYLDMKATNGRGWRPVLAVGAAVCLAALAARLFGPWSQARMLFVPTVVVGLLIIEGALDRRRPAKLARILQKYDAALEPDEAEEAPE